MSESYTGRFENTGFGEGEFGHYFAAGQNDSNLQKLIEEWDNDALIIEEVEDDLPHQILTVLAHVLSDIDRDIDDLHDTRFIDSARGRELEMLGEQVGVSRYNDEDDDKLRIRINSGYSRAVSDTTFDMFASAVLNIFDAEPDEISITGAADEPVAVIDVPLSRVKNSPLTESQITDELTQSVSACDGVRIRAQGTFELGGPNYTTSDNSGLNQGTLGYTFES